MKRKAGSHVLAEGKAMLIWIIQFLKSSCRRQLISVDRILISSSSNENDGNDPRKKLAIDEEIHISFLNGIYHRRAKNVVGRKREGEEAENRGGENGGNILS